VYTVASRSSGPLSAGTRLRLPSLNSLVPVRRCRRATLPTLTACLLAAVVFMSGFRTPCRAQSNTGQVAAPPRTAAQTTQETPVEVAVLISPVGSGNARVGLGYSRCVPHRRVLEEIAGLKRFGWRIVGSVEVDDQNPVPGNPKGSPLMTGAQFELADAPQIVNGIPAVRPYLEALHQWTSVEVIFAADGRGVSTPADDFHSPAVSIVRVPGEGVYRYEALIHDHSGPLTIPAGVASPGRLPTAAGTAARAATAPTNGHAASGGSVRLMWVGAALVIAGACALFVRRHAERSS